MVDAVAVLAQPAGLSVMAALAVGVVALRRGDARRRAAQFPAGVLDLEALDVAAANELRRARRYGRPLATIAFTTQCGESVARLAAGVALSTRVTDVVGLAGQSTVTALLPEVTGHEATNLVRRIADLLDEDVASQVIVGIASFPQNAVTWIGLQASGQHHARPLADFRPAHEEVGELRRDPPRPARQTLGTEPGLTASSVVHLADPTA